MQYLILSLSNKNSYITQKWDIKYYFIEIILYYLL